jgi:hypothetical protein
LSSISRITIDVYATSARQPLHWDRHGGVLAHEGALEIGSEVVVLDR